MANADTPGDPLEAGLRIAGALAQRDIPYALGGALAYGLWGIPRATIDIDVNVFVDDDALGDVCAALSTLGIDADAEEARLASEREGLYVTRYGVFRLDLFMPSIEFSWEAGRTKVLIEVGEQKVWFLSAESIAVFKLLFFRGKDRVDLERLIAVQGQKLDRDYVRKQIVLMMGESDERTAAWDRLFETHLPR